MNSVVESCSIYLDQLVSGLGERPVGSEKNNETLVWLEGKGAEWGYNCKSISFNPPIWEKDESSLFVEDEKFTIFPGPFSNPVSGTFEVVPVCTIDELGEKDFRNKLLFLYDEIAMEPVICKDFPFYYPDNHKQINTLVEKGAPACVVAATGEHPMSGENPYPLFEDPNLEVPNGFLSGDGLISALRQAKKATISLNSKKKSGFSRQLVFSNSNEAPRIIICAHMDTKYDTLGALDNGSGVSTLLRIMQSLSDFRIPCEFVPFNSEEYLATGEVLYLEHLKQYPSSPDLVINMDGLGHIDSSSAFSFYNLSHSHLEVIQGMMKNYPKVTEGEQWIAGDHSIFWQQEIPAIAVTSSNIFGAAKMVTHTAQDTLDQVDPALLDQTADLIVELLQDLFC